MLTRAQISHVYKLIDAHCKARCAVVNYSAESDGPVERFAADVTTSGQALDKWLESVEVKEPIPAKIEEFRWLIERYGMECDDGGEKSERALALEHQLLAAIAQLLSKSDD